MEKQKRKQHQIKIELDDNVGQGEYVNLAIVTHSPAEFVMDFIWTENSPIAIHVSDEGYYPQLQSFANHYDLPVRYLPTNEDYYPQ